MKNQRKLTERFLEMTTVTCVNVICTIQFDFIVTSRSLQEISELRLISSKTCPVETICNLVESEME